MTPSRPRTAAAVAIAVFVALTACGSDDAGDQLPETAPAVRSDVPTAADQPVSNDADAPVPTAADEPVSNDADAPVPSDGATPSDDRVDEPEPIPGGTIIGSSNIGGPVVDPQPHPIDDIAIAESYPEQLFITFRAGDPNCLAADAVAIAVGDTVVVRLEVGIGEDALTKSCMAGTDFEQSISIALDEGLDGRSVVVE